MSDGSLSQEEIDALLQGDSGDSFGGGSQAGGFDFQDEGLSDQELQLFQDMLNKTVEGQSSNLSGLLGGKNVTIGNPTVAATSSDEVSAQLPDQVVEVDLDYVEGITGQHLYLLDDDASTLLAGLMVGQEQIEMNEMALESLKEALSTIAGVALTSIGDSVGTTIMPSSGDSKQTAKGGVSFPQTGMVKAEYPVTIDGENPIQLIELFDLAMVKQLISMMSQSGGQAAQTQAGAQLGDQQFPGFGQGMQQQQMQQQNFGQPQQQYGMGTQMGGPQMGDQSMGGQFGGQQMGGYQAGGQIFNQQQPPNVQSVQFPSLNSQGGGGESGNISLLMDVYMEMTVELGRTKKSIKEILGMGEGTIIELDKLAGEPVDILVNHKLIATGEVVVIDENFGVRVTEIVSPSERMKDLT